MAAPELKPIEGKYEILEKLNEGGMGAVYKVQHRLLEEIRVIKVIRPQLQSDENLRRRFLREARAAVRLRHPNIAQLYDFTVAEDGTAYMVIEFIDGVDLVHLIQQSTLPEIGLVLDIGIQSLRALAYLHRKQFVHRDISPDNLMLTKDVEGHALVKLIDLGIAKPLESDMNLTGEGLFLGKVRYASPEQFGGQSGKEDIDHRSDLYSFGIVLYELLTGVHPITGDDNQSVLAGHLFHPPRDFAETDPQNRVPQPLRDVVLKALAKSADDRFENAEVFSQQLTVLLNRGIGGGSESISVDATVVRPKPGISPPRPGSTQDRLDLEFAPHPTPPPRPLEAVKPSREDRRESLLQACCDKIESLLASRNLMEAEVELQRGDKALGSSILLSQMSDRIADLRGKVDEAVVRARLLQRQGDHAAALEQLGEARDIDAENPEVAALSDELGAALEQRDREIDTARRAIEAQLEAGQPEEAQRGLRQAQQKFGRFARMETLAERIEALLAAADRVRKIATASTKVHELIKSGKLDRAAAVLSASIKTHGEDDMFSELAEQITALKSQEEQQRRLTREAEIRLQVKSLLELSARLAEADNFAAALEQLDQAARLDPENVEIEKEQQRIRRSIDQFDRLQQQAHAIETLTTRVDEQLVAERFDAALELVAEARTELGSLPELSALRARVDELRLEQQEKAAGELLNEAYRDFEAGRLDHAGQKVEQALGLSPDLPQARKLHQKLIERQREKGRLEALDRARAAILESVDNGALDAAEAILERTRKDLGAIPELEDLQQKVQQLKAQESRQLVVQKAANPIEKLIAKGRLKKASEALAEAVRRHGQDTVFDELRARIEDLAEREQAAQEILDTEVGAAVGHRRSIGIALAAIAVLVLGIVLYLAWPRPETRPVGAVGSATDSTESHVSLDELLEGRSLGDYYALVIGNNSYQSGLPNLDTAVNDAQQLAATLKERFGFETRLLTNASRYEILSALEDYIERLGGNDNLLLFYAGHGFVDEVTGRGYWQPIDAEPDNTANWISSLEVSDVLLDIPARRVLIVTDSCFSGAFAQGMTQAPDEITEAVTPEEVVERLDQRSRRVLSSGSVQPVMDNGAHGNSVFSGALLSALDGATGALESETLFDTVRREVTAATVGKDLQQQPQFTPLDSDDGGVFVFVPVDHHTS